MPDAAAQRVPVVGRPAELELPGDVAGEARGCGGSRGPARGVGSFEQPVGGTTRRPSPSPRRAACGAAAPCSGRRVVYVQLDAGLGGQLLDGADEVDVLDLLDEREHVARRVAAEALVAAGLLADVERRRLLGVERAQPDPVAPDLAQLRRTAGRRRRSRPSSASRSMSSSTIAIRPRLPAASSGRSRIVRRPSPRLGERRHGGSSPESSASARRAGGPLRRQREPTDAARTRTMTRSESQVGMWYHSSMIIFTPTKARMTARPCCR